LLVNPERVFKPRNKESRVLPFRKKLPSPSISYFQVNGCSSICFFYDRKLRICANFAIANHRHSGLAIAVRIGAKLAIAPCTKPRFALGIGKCRSERARALSDSGQGNRFRCFIRELVLLGNTFHVFFMLILAVFFLFSMPFFVSLSPRRHGCFFCK